MSMPHKFSSHLPGLRRYARALTNSQRAGDALVLTTLEQLTRQVDQGKLPDRIQLYRVLSRLWNGPVGWTIASQQSDPSDPTETAVPLAAVSTANRQAYLLVAMEGFEPQEAARILEFDDASFATVLMMARREIEAEIATRVLIIEDEFFIAADLQSIMFDLGHQVVGTARTLDEAERIAEDQDFGLVLADIQLADGSSGIDAVNSIIDRYRVPVIFITAYPERLLTGLRPEPTFLIEKPFRADAVRAAVSQALFFKAIASRSDTRPGAVMHKAADDLAVSAATTDLVEPN